MGEENPGREHGGFLLHGAAPFRFETPKYANMEHEDDTYLSGKKSLSSFSCGTGDKLSPAATLFDYIHN